MTKVWKLLLGAVTVWPVAHLVLFVVAAFHSICGQLTISKVHSPQSTLCYHAQPPDWLVKLS